MPEPPASVPAPGQDRSRRRGGSHPTEGCTTDGHGSNQPSGRECVVRRAGPADADAIAAVLTTARAEQAFMPPLHTPADDHRFVTERLLPANEVWVVAEAGEVVGFASFGAQLLGHFYVAPWAQRRGIGRALLNKVKERRPDGFTLWTHQPNVQARAFYEREGLAAVELTDGSANDEQVPDVRYAWRTPGRAAHER